MTKFVFLNKFEIISNLKFQAETLNFYKSTEISYRILSVDDALSKLKNSSANMWAAKQLNGVV